MTPVAALHRQAAELGKLAVRMTAVAGSGHPSSALSLAHVIGELMLRRMRYDPGDPSHPGADRLVLSEGHAVPIVYAAYATLGGAVAGGERGAYRPLAAADLDGLRERDSVLDGHPNPAEGFPFFDAATGSLGQGLSVAAGLGLAARLRKCERRIYAICGDGESREGQIWEAVDFIVDHRLTNVVAVFNCNGQGQAGLVSVQQSPERLMAKLAAFGWSVVLVDGHDPEALAGAFDQAEVGDHPTAIIARTIKGWGVADLQKGNWHGKPPQAADLDAANRSLDATVAALTGGAAAAGGPLRPKAPAAAKASCAAPPDPALAAWPAFADAMRAGGFGAALEKGALATRRAYGATLKVAGDLLPQVVCLDADVSNSTFSEVFAKAHPDRFFECKIAEQNMVSVAAGLAAGGMIPFVNSFAKFLTRAYDQIELANISRANVKLVGSHSGITPCSDGPSQMALTDVSFFRAFTTVRGDDRRSPLCWFFQPADAVAAYACTKLMATLPGMCYMRTHRPDVPLLYGPETVFEPGGFHVDGSGDALALISSGYMVHEARRAIELLAKQGCRATLLDCYSLPIDPARLAEVLARCGRRALVVEDNYGGGVGAAVAEVAARSGCARVATLNVQRYPKSTRLEDEELAYCGVSGPQIADHALALVRSQ